MNHDQKEIIYDYFQIDKNIRSKKKRLEYAVLEFNSLNYCGSTVFSYGDGVQYQGFRVDTRVVGYVDYITTLELHIKKLERKKYYFDQFLSTLSIDARRSLRRRYINPIESIGEIQSMPSDQKVLDEIKEIEEAIKFQFGYDYLFNLKHEIEINKKNRVGTNQKQRSANYAKVAQIENAEFTNDTVEDSFDKVTELLGV